MSDVEVKFRSSNRTDLTLFCLQTGGWEKTTPFELVDLARDLSLAMWRRRAAVIQLFLRFALAAPVKQLVDDWMCGDWIPTSEVFVTPFIGPCPLYYDSNEQKVVTVLRPTRLRSVDWTTIYLCVSGAVDEQTMREFFHTGNREINSRVLDVGVTEVYRWDKENYVIYDAHWVHPSHTDQRQAAVEHLQRNIRALEVIWQQDGEWE